MKIDLFYYTPYFNNYYFVYGPEKNSNGDIIIKGTGYYFAEANDMVAKLRSMADSLAPEITNVQARTQGNSFWIYVGDLNTGSPDVSDYTQILTNINNSLVNIGVKLSTSQNGNNQTGIATILSNIFQYSNGASSIKSGSTTTESMNSANLIKQINRLISMFYFSDPNYFEQINSSQKLLRYIYSTLKQSVSPNASITDVISALNATIDSKQDTTIVNNEVTPLAEINIDVPFEVKNLKKSDVENL